jgi:hypothetical protein
MRSIYTNTEQVIIWLGLGDELTLRAWGFIQCAARCGRAESQNPSDLKSEPYDDFKNVERGFPARENSDADGLEPLYAFFSLPWFTRVWIVQEVVATRSAVVMLGELQLPYSDFCAAIIFFQSKG